MHEQRLGSFRLGDRQGAAERAQRVVRLSQRQKRAGKIVVGIDEIRLARERLLKPLRGLREIAAREEYKAKIVVRLGQVRLERKRALVALHCLVEASFRQQRVAEIGVGVGKVRIDRERPFELRGG